MTLNERAAYIKGLADGLDLDESKPEVKVIKEMLELIYDLTDELSLTQDEIDDVCDVIDDLRDEVGELEEDFDDLTDFLAEDDYDDDLEDDEDNFDYEVKCPDCGAEIVVDEDTLIEGEISCPNCGNELEFDFSSLFSDENDENKEDNCPIDVD